MANFAGGPAGWNVNLSHDEVTKATTAADIAALGVPSPYNVALAAAADYLRMIDQLGGNNGVNITGVGTAIMATPAGIPIIGQVISIITAIGEGVSSQAIDLARKLGGLFDLGSSPGEVHADEDDIGGQERFTLVVLSEGNEHVMATSDGNLHIVGVTNDGGMWHEIRQPDGQWLRFGDIKQTAKHNPGRFIAADCTFIDGNLHIVGVTDDGGMWHEIRQADGQWLRFGDINANAGNDPGRFIAAGCNARLPIPKEIKQGKVAILSHRGYFCADHIRAGRVWADRHELSLWETWGLVHNADGTVSFSSDQGWYMCTHPDRDKEIWTDSPAVQGEGEKFGLELIGNGQIALRSRATNQYVSVAP